MTAAAAVVLRPYQADMITAILASHANGHRRILAQMATGGGKTITMGHMVRRYSKWGEMSQVQLDKLGLNKRKKQQTEE